MSPVGGVGINYAIQDAVVAANVLAGPLKTGKVTDADLAEVQRQREWPTRVIQSFQSFMQRNLIARVLESREDRKIPWQLRWIMAMPARSASRTLAKRVSIPSMRIVPQCSAWTPERILTSVDLPAPFSPIRAWTSPRLSSIPTSWSTATPENAFERPSALRIVVDASPLDG